MITQIHQYMKDKPVQSFLIIVVLILLAYYIYTRFFRKEHLDMSKTPFAGMGSSAVSSLISLILVFWIILPYIILYYIIKVANKNAIRETSQSKSK